MPRPAQARNGERLETLGRPTLFSYWPTRRPRAHAMAQSILFSLDPWMLLKQVVTEVLHDGRRAEALACLEQAKEFFVVGTEKGLEAARPLALYYSYMNLTKVYCLTHGNSPSFDRAQHGLSEQPNPAGHAGLEFSDLTAFPSPNNDGKYQVFDELMKTLTGTGIGGRRTFRIRDILPQILSGHRLWAQAVGQRERFVCFHDIQFWRNRDTREVWLRLYLVGHDLSRLRISHREFLQRSRLDEGFREVQCDKGDSGERLVCLEQTATAVYPDRHPADVLEQLVANVRPRLWATIATVPPYRRYYAYLCPANEQANVLPQILTIYALTYYLGSITRYRPQDFEGILAGRFGPRVHDFITGQALQFLYLMTSEIARREITKPSIL